MISLNAVCAKFLLSALHAKKEKGVIHASRPRSVVETILNNAFVILVIFKNDAVSVQQNSTIHVAKTLVFKNCVPNVRKYHPNIHQEVNNFKLILFKIILIFL